MEKIKRFLIKLILFFGIIFGLLFFSQIVIAGWSSEPMGILDGMKDSSVQNTAIDNTSGKGVKDVLEGVKNNSTGYVQWLGFIGLSAALILIIRLGIYILGNFTEENKIAKAKKRFVSLIVGVVVLTSGYVIIKAIMTIIGNIS